MKDAILNKEEEAKFVIKRIRWYKKEIPKIEKRIKAFDSTVAEYNDGKTIGQNPEIKTLNDYTKNINSLYNTLLKLTESSGGGDSVSEVLGFIQERNKRK